MAHAAVKVGHIDGAKVRALADIIRAYEGEQQELPSHQQPPGPEASAIGGEGSLGEA
jgi:hypothetical protein